MGLSQDEVAALTKALSEERLVFWRDLAAGPNLAAWRARVGCKIPVTNEHAILLHEWNATLAFSLLASLQILEISLRNHMNDALTAHFQSETWWGEWKGSQMVPSACVLGKQAEDIGEAIRVAARRPKGITPGGVISELSFGFWLALIGPAYDNPANKNLAYWRNCLSAVFSRAKKVSRKEVHDELEQIIKIRNTCAHHEPIVHLQVVVEFSNAVAFARRFCHHTAGWMLRTSLVPHLMKPDWLNAIKTGGRLIGSSNI